MAHYRVGNRYLSEEEYQEDTVALAGIVSGLLAKYIRALWFLGITIAIFWFVGRLVWNAI